MKTLTNNELKTLAGDYFAPEGLYQHLKSLPFVGTLQCNTKELVAGQWTEIIVEYAVGSSGLADGAWIKGTFKFYSDWALFQTSDPKQDDYVSAEYVAGPLVAGQTPATVKSLAVRFDQKGHERPFQKAVIIDVVDGYLNPGDKIIVRLGDRRWGSKGTRVQTFVEDKFLMRWYVDPVGTSRFAPIKPDIAFPIVPGPIAKIKAITPRVVKPDTTFPVHAHTEDLWGNATISVAPTNLFLEIREDASSKTIWEAKLPFPREGWEVVTASVTLPKNGDYYISSSALDSQDTVLASSTEYVTAESSLPVPRPLFADLHVHSDDTVGTNSTTYNFSYAQQVAGLDVVGYTANDFNITKERWDQTLNIIREVNETGKLSSFLGRSGAAIRQLGETTTLSFLTTPRKASPSFPSISTETSHVASSGMKTALLSLFQALGLWTKYMQHMPIHRRNICSFRTLEVADAILHGIIRVSSVY